MLAFGFATPLLLLGLLAAGIPFVLHLLASVRAQDMMFPTLRFLRMSMEKTARRRRLQHWLLLILRAVLFALLALAVAEPISEATGGWLRGERYAAAIVLDNSYSMATNGHGGSRLERAKTEAIALLNGDEKPSVAALLTTNGGFVSHDTLSAGLDDLRKGIARAQPGYGPTTLGQRVRSALALLAEDSSPRKALYVFSDLQRSAFEQITALEALAEAQDVHLMVVNAAGGRAENVGISDLRITGRRVVDSVVELTLTLVNSSATDKTVDVAFQVDGASGIRQVRKTLRAAGREGSTTTVRFHHRFTEAGQVSGRFYLVPAGDGAGGGRGDDLAVDDTRWFCLTVGDRVRALVVRGTGEIGPMDPSAMVRLALQPYEDAATPWPIRSRIVEIDRLAAEDLQASDIAFLCGVEKFTLAQARAVEEFVAGGGTAVVFLGPDVDAGNYGERLVQQVPAHGGLLPARLDRPVGEIGPEAGATKLATVAVDHPYFAGLYESHTDYLSVLVQRYWRLQPAAGQSRTLIELADGHPLLVAKDFGGGRVVLCTTGAGPSWSNLPITGLFLPMVARMSLLARRELRGDETFTAGDHVPIRPDLARVDPPVEADEKLFVHVTPPGDAAEPPPPLPLTRKAGEGWLATFTGSAERGLYAWRVTKPGGEALPTGTFAVNPYGAETRLEPMPARVFQKSLRQRGLERVYVAPTLAEVHAAAAGESQGRNWWDLLLAVAIMVLVFEAIVANRRTREEAVPAHLQRNAPV